MEDSNENHNPDYMEEGEDNQDGRKKGTKRKFIIRRKCRRPDFSLNGNIHLPVIII